MEYKQVILMRADLKLPNGKMAAQASHAAVEAVLKSDKDIVRHWRNSGSMKIVLKVRDIAELYRFAQAAKDSGLSTAIITDAGKTVIAPGTATCCGIGPDSIEKIDRIVGDLSMI